MKLNVYSMFDSKAAVYGNPMFFVNDATAVRTLTRAVNDQRSELFYNAEDYTLNCIGEFDDNTAFINSFPPRPVIVASALKTVQMPIGTSIEDVAKNGIVKEVVR